jgi:lipopolysaccharide export system permease protein
MGIPRISALRSAIRFGLTERYIFRTALVACLATLLVLTAVIWITQALKELDLLTAKGQTIIVFLIITSLTLPAMITIIAPVALFIATVFTLNKLNGDSELVVMSAAGMSPSTIFKPFAVLALLIALLVGYMTYYLMPASLSALRDMVTKIRVDLVANILKEGQFTTLDVGITFHFRERAADTLFGVFMQDGRDKTKVTVYIAERGRIVEANNSSYLILENGTVQRQTTESKDTAIIAFQRYAVDLSQLSPDSDNVVYKPRERSTMELLNPKEDDQYYKLQSARNRPDCNL